MHVLLLLQTWVNSTCTVADLQVADDDNNNNNNNTELQNTAILGTAHILRKVLM
jgi:hypothetical protein